MIVFGVFGNISSIYVSKNDFGKYAFICFNSTNVQDREYGFIAA